MDVTMNDDNNSIAFSHEHMYAFSLHRILFLFPKKQVIKEIKESSGNGKCTTKTMAFRGRTNTHKHSN